MSHFDKAKSWLQARFIEHSRRHNTIQSYTSSGIHEPTEEDRWYAEIPVGLLHDFLISIGAPVQKTIRLCEIAEFICFVEAGFNPERMSRFYHIQAKVLEEKPYSPKVPPVDNSKRRHRKIAPKAAERKRQRKAQEQIDKAIETDWCNKKHQLHTYEEYVTWKNENLPNGWPKLTSSEMENIIQRVRKKQKRIHSRRTNRAHG